MTCERVQLERGYIDNSWQWEMTIGASKGCGTYSTESITERLQGPVRGSGGHQRNQIRVPRKIPAKVRGLALRGRAGVSIHWDDWRRRLLRSGLAQAWSAGCR